MTDPQPFQARRAEDKGFWCIVAHRMSEAWDFIDNRDIEKYVLIVWVFAFTTLLSYHLILFADRHMDKSGIELAAVIGAITLPWSWVAKAAVEWFFKARMDSTS
jgi:hypothetical protein